MTPMVPVRVRADDVAIRIDTLEQALRYARENPRPKGDYEGMIRRLEAASEPEDVLEAGDAFRWWAESNAPALRPPDPDARKAARWTARPSGKGRETAAMQGALSSAALTPSRRVVPDALQGG